MINPIRGLLLIPILFMVVLLSGCGALNQRLEEGTAAVQEGNGDLAHGLSAADAGGIATSVQLTVDAAMLATHQQEDRPTDTATITVTIPPTITSTPVLSPTITVSGVQYTAMAQTFTAMVVTPTNLGTPPTATPSPTGEPGDSTSNPDQGTPCLSMKFISHITYPPGSIVAPNTSFYKSWYIENDGTCTWSSGFSIVYHSGYQLGGMSPLPLGTTVYPGQRVTVTVLLFTNPQPGTYDSNWWLQSTNGAKFGIGERHDQPLPAVIVVPGEPDPVFVSPAVTSPPFYTPTP